jgi:hypothetical protein
MVILLFEQPLGQVLAAFAIDWKQPATTDTAIAGEVAVNDRDFSASAKTSIALD